MGAFNRKGRLIRRGRLIDHLRYWNDFEQQCNSKFYFNVYYYLIILNKKFFDYNCPEYIHPSILKYIFIYM